MPWGPWWSQREGGPHAHAVGASVIPKRKRPPRPCGGGLGDHKAKEAPHAHAVGASVIPMRRRPPTPMWWVPW